ncbi:hypoxia-inducible factor 1-alpha-like isoform X2 [Gigantopelta aegis]|uniref:hypoxia-inducible factor 1-alpha-like isoform X2 n=1 Tax=Gigantopelta aegis TaxID=1735272 RepID=UPI001B88B8D2|nr:hypoxia-inducible factor 1-alpha-like isoform X2 [Gigantopelta aegis]
MVFYKTRSKLDHDKEEKAASKEKMSRGMKAKEAAQKRRDNEAVEMERLSDVLPLTRDVIDKLDKGSIIRLAIAYIRIKHTIQRDIEYHNQNAIEMGEGIDMRRDSRRDKRLCRKQDMEVDQLMKSGTHSKALIGCGNNVKSIMDSEGLMMEEALQGFIIYISRKGKILFVSTSVEEHLGLKQTMLLGRSVLDVIHQSDHKELGQQFQVKMSQVLLPDVVDGEDAGDHFSICDEVDLSSRMNTGEYVLNSHQTRVFYVRMKYNMHHNGNKTKHTGFMLVQWSGHLKIIQSAKPRGYSVEGMTCVCRPVQTNSILEIRLDGNMFMSRHDLDMKFTFCDPRIITLIGYEPREVIGRTAYYFHNPLDAQKIQSCHSTLIVKGNSVSKYYRFCGKNGDWVWMQTRATIIYNTSNKPQYVVCMNYVIGEEEGQRCLMMEQDQPGFSQGESKGYLDLTSHCKSLEEFEQDGGYSTMSPANSPLCGSTSSEFSQTNCLCESGDEFMVDTDVKLSPSYIEDNTLSPVELPLSTSFQSTVHDSLSSSSGISSDMQSGLPSYLQDESSPFTSSNSLSHMPLSQNSMSSMETGSVFQNDSDFSDSSLQQDRIPTGSNDPFLSEMKEDSLVSGSEFEFIDEFLNCVGTNSVLKPDSGFQSMNVSPTQPDRTPLKNCDSDKEPSLLRTLLNKGCSSPASSSSLDSPTMCSAAFVQSPPASVLDSPCGPSGNCSALSMNMPNSSEIQLTRQPGTPAMCSVQVGMINSVDIPPSTFSETDSHIADDILDFAMLYCDSIADEQARLVMHDLGQVIGSESWPNGVDEFITTMVDAQNFSNESIATVAALETVSDTSKSVDSVTVRSSPIRNSEENEEMLWATQNSGNGVQGVQKSFKMENNSAVPALITQVSSPSVKLNSLPVSSSSTTLNKLSKNPKVIFSTKGSQTSFGTKSISVPVTHGLPQKVVVGQNVSQKREMVNGLLGNGTTSTAAYSRYTSPKPSTSGRIHPEKVHSSSVSSMPFTFPNSKSSYQNRLLVKANAAGVGSSPCGSQRSRSMTELEKHLRGYMDDEVDKLQKRHDKVSGKISRLNISDMPDANDIPFLQMLLTGELSQDKYYRIDRELRNKEKKSLHKHFSSNTSS